MKQLVKKVFVDCEQRFYSIFQCNDLYMLENACDELLSDGEVNALTEELNLASAGPAKESWNAMRSHIENGGSCFFVDHDGYTVSMHATLDVAKERAETYADESLKELQQIDEAYAATWRHVVRLKSAVLGLDKLAQEAKESIAPVGNALESACIDLDDPPNADLKHTHMAIEEDIYTVLKCIRRFQGKDCEESPLDDPLRRLYPHVNYALPARKRMK